MAGRYHGSFPRQRNRPESVGKKPVKWPSNPRWKALTMRREGLLMPQATMDAPTTFAYRQRTYERFDTAGQVEGLKRDGFALIPGVLNADEVKRARQEIDRLRPFGFDVLSKGGPGEVDHFKC